MALFESLILVAIAAAKVLYVGMWVLLVIQEIQSWFDSVPMRSPHDIGFTIKEALEGGQARIVQGVFNKRTQQLTTPPRSMDAQRLDEQLESYHATNKVVIYT